MPSPTPAPPLVDAAPSVPSLRTLGTGATQAAAGNDSRFGAGGAITQLHGDGEAGPGVGNQLFTLINIQGPLVKRVFVSLSIRIRSGVPNSDVADRVRSAVATVINRTPIGTAIALSDIVSAAGSCRGVLSVSVISPTYGAGNDRIPVQPFEKPLVLNLDQDIQISFAGE